MYTDIMETSWLCTNCMTEHKPGSHSFRDSKSQYPFCDEECWYTFYKDEIEANDIAKWEQEVAARGNY